MKQLLIIAGLLALSTCRPDMYKEKEDFQYSRSSTDEGSKAGYYGAQRGNMGGNFEKAHNMDGLAQSQMSGMVRQVHSQLGEGLNTRTGDVFGAASTRGIYGEGQYDLNNLAGRNFHEGVSYEDASQASMSSHSAYKGHSASSSSHNTGHSGRSSFSLQNADYRRHGATGHSQQLSDVQDSDMRSNSNYYGEQHGSGYHSESGYSGRSEYDRSTGNVQGIANSYGDDSRRRYTNYSPMRVILRPGTKVSVPFTAQTTNNVKTSEIYDENSINRGAESVTNGENIRVNPSSKTKHYQSEFSYRKEWEKHDTKPVAVPLAVPTINPIAYETNTDAYYGQQNSNGQSANARFTDTSNYNANAGSQRGVTTNYDRYQSHHAGSKSHTYDEFEQDQNQHSSSSSAINTHNQGRSNGYRNLVGSLTDQAKTLDYNTEPKRYESAYSYHKSWERRGDPYVILPTSSAAHVGDASQRLTDVSSRHGEHSSHQSGSQQYKHTHQSYSSSHNNGDDCYDENGQMRVVRSADSHNTRDEQNDSTENLGQQTQSDWDVGQQTQDSWGNLEQQSQGEWENLENLGQHTQSHWGKLEDFGQQSQNSGANLEDIGQQTQNSWGKSEDLGMQIQNSRAHLEDLGQQTQNNWGQAEDLQQQTHNSWMKFDNMGQQVQNKPKGQNSWTQTDDKSGQNNKNDSKLDIIIQQNQNNSAQVEDIMHDSNDTIHLQVLGHHKNGDEVQQREIDNLDQKTQNESISYGDKQVIQNSENKWITVENSNATGLQQEYVQSNIGIKPVWEYTEEEKLNNFQDNQYQQSENWNYHMNMGVHNHTGWHHSHQSEQNQFNSHYNHNMQNVSTSSATSLQNLWDKLGNLERRLISNNNKMNVEGNYYLQNSDQSDWHLRQNQTSVDNKSHNQNNTLLVQNETDHATWHKIINENVHDTEKNLNIDTSNTDNNRKPMDIGRGDIGPEDTNQFTKTSQKPEIYVNMQPKYFKTPEEIESLSLTTKNNNSNIVQNINSNNNRPFTSYQDSLQASNENKFKEESQSRTVQIESKNISMHNSANTHNNKEISVMSPKDISQERYDTGQQFEDFGQQFENFDQENHGQWNIFDKNGHAEELEQQVQTSWNPSENLMKELQQTQELINLEKSVHNRDQNDGFYGQRHWAGNIGNVETNQKLTEPVVIQEQIKKPESAVTNNKDEMENHSISETLSPPEVQTENPGFWKSLGNKFTNAKDKVSSWFSRS